MPSPSAPAPNQRSSASAAGGGVHGESAVGVRQVASGGGSAHGLTPLVWRTAAWGWSVGREEGEQWPGGRWGPLTFPRCQKAGGPFRSLRNDRTARGSGQAIVKKVPNEANGNRPQILCPQRVNVGCIRPSLCKTNPIPGGRGRDIEGLAVVEASTETSSAPQDRAAQNAR